MKIITISLALFLVVVIGLMAAMVADYLNGFEYLAANVVWFGLFFFLAWVANETKKEVTSRTEESNETTE